MATEIERRFLVRDTAFLAGCQGESITQGYVSREAGAPTVRVQVRDASATITLKSPLPGITRDEFEYEIPLDDALEMLSRHCAGCTVEKTRYWVRHGEHLFEVDVFHGRHSGLVIAKIALQREDQGFDAPPWLGPEITHEARYSDFALALLQGPATLPPWPH